MADHDEFDASELASAYLDGEVSDVERARVESDAALVAEVERLRRVRAALGEVPTAPSASREAAVAAHPGTKRREFLVFEDQPGLLANHYAQVPIGVVPLVEDLSVGNDLRRATSRAHILHLVIPLEARCIWNSLLTL